MALGEDAEARERVVVEGAAQLVVTDQLAAQPGATAGFYNPRMRLNRELCLAELHAVLQSGPWRAGGPSGGEGLGAQGHDVRVLDAFAASGALAVRIALELAPRHDRRLEVTAADIEPACCELLARNAALNRLRVRRLRTCLLQDDGGSPQPAASAPSGCGGGGGGGEGSELQVVCGDARALLLLSPPFEYAHLDPFGSCTPHLDAVAARAPHGGVLSLTATDTAALYAHYPQVARRGYAAVLDRKDPNWREAGVRALCAALATAAARHGRGIEVLHAAAAAHFVHLVARLERGARAADRAVARLATLSTPDGTALGPLWTGALNCEQYVRRCVEAAAAAEARAEAAPPDKAAAREARQLLERSLDDAPALPCFSYATGHASPAKVVAALRERGFAAARSAFDGDASKPGSSRRVRTDAPAAVFAEVLEQVGSC